MDCVSEEQQSGVARNVPRDQSHLGCHAIYKPRPEPDQVSTANVSLITYRVQPQQGISLSVFGESSQ